MNLKKNHIETESTTERRLVRRMSDLVSNMPSQFRSSNRGDGTSGSRKVESLKEICVDSEGTSSNFKRSFLFLFLSIFFKAHAEYIIFRQRARQLRRQSQIAQSESAFAASRAVNVMSLNSKL